MLYSVSFPMWARGEIATVEGVLDALDGNGLVWSILEYDVVGGTFLGLSQADFQDLVLSTPNGLRLTWPKLLDLAKNTTQLITGLLIGASADVVVNAATVEEEGFPGCKYVVEAIDSTDWTVMAQSEADLSRLPPERVAAPKPSRGPAQPL